MAAKKPKPKRGPGRPSQNKKAAPKAEKPTKTPAPIPTPPPPAPTEKPDSVSRLGRKALEAAPAAKLKLFQNLIQRIAGGKQLSAAEMKQFRELEQEISGSLPEENGDGILIANTFEAAKYCGVSERSIKNNVQAGRITQHPDGTYPKASLDHYLAKKRSGLVVGPGTDGIQEPLEVLKQRADLRYRVARAESQELMTEQLKGAVYNREEIAQEWGLRLSTVINGLNAWAVRLGPLFVGRTLEEIEALIKDEVRGLIEAYRARGKYTPKVKEAEKTKPKQRKKR